MMVDTDVSLAVRVCRGGFPRALKYKVCEQIPESGHKPYFDVPRVVNCI